jgi:drug/metabolite transporter (DMT)-like permease
MQSLLPVLSLLYSATFWGIVWYPLRLLADAGLHGLWQAVASYLAAGTLLLVVHAAGGAPLRGRARDLWRMSLAAGWCNVAFMIAMLEGNVVRVLLLFYLSPVWAVLLARWWLGERMTRRSLAVLAAALAGAAVMLYEPAIGVPLPSTRADGLALSAGLAFAVTTVEARRLQAVSIPAKTLASWVSVIAVALAWIVVSGVPVPAAPAGAWAGALALGWTGFFLATIAVQFGTTRLPVQRSAVVMLFELVVGALSSAWLAGEYTGAREWVGGFLIAAAGLAAARNDEVV